MGRVRLWWRGIRGQGKSKEVMERHMGPWAGSGCGREAFEALGRVSEGWGGIRGHGLSEGVI